MSLSLKKMVFFFLPAGSSENGSSKAFAFCERPPGKRKTRKGNYTL
jgi:hypothetical protein